ncbi:hypothetical protein B0T24DRAFT_670982 [Lasiosphaeria ovina]|uniref:Integral membrane protein n=1 Tax=Lasiosphaeria ovina TaxID=92902 RepID=A0AAE0JUN3_9PEZI|nr:hypothetical protein B0T24DRAFT_670982 [Lasiosphaeria ovina]
MTAWNYLSDELPCTCGLPLVDETLISSLAMSLDIDPRGDQLFTVQVVFLILVWIFIFLRAFVRFLIIKRVSLDDILMFLCVLIYTAYAILSICGILYASEARSTNPLGAESIGLHSWFVCEVIYAPLSAMIRTPTSHFYGQVLGQPGSLALALMPIAILWNVRLGNPTKFGIAALLGIGIFIGLWSLMEISLGIIAGSYARWVEAIRERDVEQEPRETRPPADLGVQELEEDGTDPRTQRWRALQTTWNTVLISKSSSCENWLPPSLGGIRPGDHGTAAMTTGTLTPCRQCTCRPASK